MFIFHDVQYFNIEYWWFVIFFISRTNQAYRDPIRRHFRSFFGTQKSVVIWPYWGGDSTFKNLLTDTQCILLKSHDRVHHEWSWPCRYRMLLARNITGTLLPHTQKKQLYVSSANMTWQNASSLTEKSGEK